MKNIFSREPFCAKTLGIWTKIIGRLENENVARISINILCVKTLEGFSLSFPDGFLYAADDHKYFVLRKSIQTHVFPTVETLFKVSSLCRIDFLAGGYIFIILHCKGMGILIICNFCHFLLNILSIGLPTFINGQWWSQMLSGEKSGFNPLTTR